MASYSPIANTEIDTESPISESLMFRLRDNTLAIQEGDVSAPRVAGIALADQAVTAAKIALQTITAAQVLPETLTGGVGGTIAQATITPENMSPASSSYLIDADGGYATLASGILCQWIQVSTLGNGLSQTYNWKIPFPASVAFVLASTSIPNSGTANTNQLQVISGYTLTQVEVKNMDVHGSGASVGGWVFALGL